MITPTEHDKREWSRFAVAAYATGLNDVGHRFSMASAMVAKEQAVPREWYDALMKDYRDWLVFGFYPHPLV